MNVLAYLGLAALITLGVFTVVHLIRSWKAAGRRWGGGSPSVPTITPADLDEDVRKVEESRREREGK
jgi:hypothetical protein